MKCLKLKPTYKNYLKLLQEERVSPANVYISSLTADMIYKSLLDHIAKINPHASKWDVQASAGLVWPDIAPNLRASHGVKQGYALVAGRN